MFIRFRLCSGQKILGEQYLKFRFYFNHHPISFNTQPMQFFRQNLLAWDKNTDFTILFDYSKTTHNTWAIDHFQTEADQVMQQYTIKVPQLPQLTEKEKDMSYLIHNHIKNHTNIFLVEQVKRKTLKKSLTKKSSALSKEGQHQCACCEAKYRLKHRCAHTLCKKPCLRMQKNQKMRRRKYKDKSYLFSHVDQRFDDDGQYKASQDLNSQFDDEDSISTPPIRMRVIHKGKKIDKQGQMDHKTLNKQPQIAHPEEIQSNSNQHPQEPLKINDIFLNEAKQFQPNSSIEKKNVEQNFHNEDNEEGQKLKSNQSPKRSQNTIKIKKASKEGIKRPGKRIRGKGAKQLASASEIPKQGSQVKEKDEVSIKEEVQKNESNGIEEKKTPSKKKGIRRPGSQKSMSKNTASKKTKSKGKVEANKDEESQQFEENLRKKMNLIEYCSLQMIEQGMLFDFKVDEEALEPAKKEKLIKKQKPVSKTRGQIQRKIKEIGKSKLISSNQEDEEISVNLDKYLIDNEGNKKQENQFRYDKNENSENLRGEKPEAPLGQQKNQEMYNIKESNVSQGNVNEQKNPKPEFLQSQNEIQRNQGDIDEQIPNVSKDPLQNHQVVSNQTQKANVVKEDSFCQDREIHANSMEKRDSLNDNIENVEIKNKDGVQAVEADAIQEEKPSSIINKEKQQDQMNQN